MSRILCVAVVLSALSGPAMAGMSEGVAAVTVGDYEKAISEFKPLAASGDPAAQYQLAKIYLEGRGPADGVPQGIELMTKAANGGYPEAQAQLGLMYAMGLGVEVDNVKAYDWLSKAVNALPDGTRRTVAEANRDAVLKRMNAGQQNAIAAASPAKLGETQAATTMAKPAATQEAAKKPAPETTTTETTTAKTTTSAPAATTTKTVTEAAATKKPATTTATANTTATTSKPATTTAKAPAATSKPATTTANAAATTKKPAGTATDTKAPEKSTQVASAKAPEAAPSPAGNSAAQKAVQSGVRIQLISMPSEESAWNAWKQLSGKYSSQLSGLTAIVEPADLGTKGMFYRVQTGPFATVAAAQERCTAMKEAGLDCLVIGKP